MSRFLGAVATIILAVTSTGCGANQQTTPNLLATYPADYSKVVPKRGAACYGYGITVTPCPVKLSAHTKPGVVVTVSGAPLSSGSGGTCRPSKTNCFYLNPKNAAEYVIASNLSDCGKGYAAFTGFSRGGLLGRYSVRVTNTYCPDQSRH